MSYKNLRNWEIPKIELKKIIEIKNPDNSISIIYAIDNLKDEELALKLLNETKEKYINDYKNVFPYDFQVETKILARKWFIENNMNIYENTATLKETSLINNNPMNTNYERIYWVLLDKKN